MKNETAKVIQLYEKKNARKVKKKKSRLEELPRDTSTSENGNDSLDSEEVHNTRGLPVLEEEIEDDGTSEWLPISRSQVIEIHERNQIALHCCRETVNLRTLSWIMSDNKWTELLPEMMSRSDSLTSVIYANAANHVAKLRGAKSTPPQALTHYAFALKELQRDICHPVKQKSDETLFAVILLGLFEVCSDDV